MKKMKFKILDEQGINLINLFSELWINKKSIIYSSLIFLLIGIIYSLSLKNIYRASSTFYPHYEKNISNNNISNLASLAGVNLENNSSDNLPSNLYPKLINSPIFYNKLLNNNLILNNSEISYRDYLINKNSVIKITDLIFYPINQIKKIFQNENEINNENLNIEILSISDQEYGLHNYLKGVINLNLNIKEGFIELSIDDENPYIASQIALIAEKILQQSIIDFKIKNINEIYKFTNEQLEIAKKNFYHLQDSLARFKDQNKNIKSDLFLNQLNRIESEYNISKNIYNQLALNKEKTSIDVKRNTPIFTVIKPVVIPNNKISPQRSLTVFLFTIVGIIISSCFILIKNPSISIINQIINYKN